MMRLPAKKPKGMTEGKLGQAASKQKAITVPAPQTEDTFPRKTQR